MPKSTKIMIWVKTLPLNRSLKSPKVQLFMLYRCHAPIFITYNSYNLRAWGPQAIMFIINKIEIRRNDRLSAAQSIVQYSISKL